MTKRLVKIRHALRPRPVRLPTATHIMLLAVVVGLAGGYGAVAFRLFIKLGQRLVWQAPQYNLDHVRSLPHLWILLAPALGGLLVGWIVQRFATEARGHGVPEVLEAVTIRGGRIRPRLVVAKLAASGICIASGGSVGREGPIVQIGSAIGSSLGQWLRLDERRLRTLVACGAAAGIAGTFNAPVAGALFAVEIILGDFGIPHFSPIVISSVMATVISHHYFGAQPAFAVTQYALVNPAELAAYAVLGILAGLAALAFIRVLYGMEDLFEAIPVSPMLRAGIGGLLIGALALIFPEILGVGYEAITVVLRDQIVWQAMLLLVAAKIVAVSLTLGSGGSGGIFAPSLFIGSMLGGSLGSVVHAVWPAATATPGAYAMVGMGAVVAAATHAPLTAIVIIFELTNDYAIIMPLMISCIISTVLTTHMDKASIYTMKLLRRGVDLQKGRGVNVLRHLRVQDIARTDPVKVPAGAHLMELLSAIMDNPDSTLFVVDADDRMRGVITTDDLRPVLGSERRLDALVLALDIMRERYPSVAPDDSLDSVMKRLSHYRHEVPVIEDGRLLGAIWPEDLITRYNEEIFKREMAQGMTSVLGDGLDLAEVPGASGLKITELPAPRSFLGHSLGDVDLRRRFGTTVLLVRRSVEGEERIVDRVPGADFVFESGDRLLLLGPADRLQDIANS